MTKRAIIAESGNTQTKHLENVGAKSAHAKVYRN
jgi:hypothetical protein